MNVRIAKTLCQAPFRSPPIKGPHLSQFFRFLHRAPDGTVRALESTSAQARFTRIRRIFFEIPSLVSEFSGVHLPTPCVPMNTLGKFACTVLATLAVVSTQAQTRPEPPAPPTPPTRPEAPPIVVPRFGIPANSQLSPEIRALVEQYQTAAQTFATEQRALLAQVRGSTEAERAALKEQLKTTREKFLEDTQQLRADIREQIRDLRSKLREGAAAVEGAAEGRAKGRPGRP